MDSVKERQTKEKSVLLEQLKKMPIIHVACERTHVSRATYYRWRVEDKEFKIESDKAILEGEGLMDDLTESQLFSLIKDKHASSIHFYLRARNPKYKNSLTVIDERTDSDVLTIEQQAVVKAALKLARFNFSSV